MSEHDENGGSGDRRDAHGQMPSGGAALSRFDIAMAGLQLILPEAVPCEYFSQAVVYPVPRAPRRLLGMMHLRGQAVPVFDTQADSTDLLPIVQRCQLVVLRAAHEAVGLICDRPPRAVLALDQELDLPKPLPLFADALLGAYHISDDERVSAGHNARPAWTFDVARLIECCLADTNENPGSSALPAANPASNQTNR